ncbi:MAG: hypothetical protein RLZZ323_1152 [Bacteroidota bacterium]|jgi:hypothetical protein
MKLLNALCLFFIFNISCYSQVDNLKDKTTSEIVFLKDSKLKDIIKQIIIKDKHCKTDGLEWYIDFIKDDIVLISKYSIGNLIAARGINKIYATTINNEILFIVNTENIKDVFSKSKYSLDLSDFIGKSNLSIIDYSFWVIQKVKKRKYKIIKEKIYKCNK